MRQLKISTQITNRESQSLEKYLQEIGKIDMIDAEKEVELANKIKVGDEKALDDLVKANLRFVVSVAKQFQHQGLSLPDLINEGNLGLIKAAQRFDHTKGFKFISYAVWRIRQSILQGLAEQGKLVRLPQNKIGIYNKANKAYNAFEQEREREPSTEELAEILEMTEREIDILFSANLRHTSLDAPIGGGNGLDDINLIDTIKSTEDEIYHTLTQESVRNAINKVLPDKKIYKKITPEIEKAEAMRIRDKRILLAYFGLSNETTESIGKEFDLTIERMRQIKEKLIKKLGKSKIFKAIVIGNEYYHNNDNTTTKKDVVTEQWLQEKKPLIVPLSYRIIHSTTSETVEKTLSPKKAQKKTSTRVTKKKQEPAGTPQQSGDTITTVSETTNNISTTGTSNLILSLQGQIVSLYSQLTAQYTSLASYQSQHDGHIDMSLIESILQQVTLLHSTFHIYQEQYTKNGQHNIDIEKQCDYIDKKLQDIYDIIQALKQDSILQSNSKDIDILPTNSESIQQDSIVDTDIGDTIASEHQTDEEVTGNATDISLDDQHISTETIINESGNIIVALLEGKDNLPECEERKKAYSRTEEKIEAMFAQGYDWKEHLDTLGYDKHNTTYVSINTFFHHYSATKKSSIGKRETFSTILTRAKRYTGKIINEDEFYGYIVDFLQSIRKIIL